MDNYVFDEEESTDTPEVLDEEESTEEEGAFMKGYEKDEEPEECAECGGAVKEEKKVVREFEEEEYVFCSKDCAEEFEESLSE